MLNIWSSKFELSASVVTASPIEYTVICLDVNISRAILNHPCIGGGTVTECKYKSNVRKRNNACFIHNKYQELILHGYNYGISLAFTLTY